jgi:hypothetical protein
VPFHEGGFEVGDEFLGENDRIGKVVGFFKAFVSEPENVEAWKRLRPL